VIICLSGQGVLAASNKASGATMKITSSAFADGQTIPKQYTGDGKNISPPLAWSGAPEKTKSFALICDDPDAPVGTWIHWVVYDIPAKVQGFDEAVTPQAVLNQGGKHGTSSFKSLGYGGPAPPAGKVHHYYFKLYALDAELGLKPGATKQQVLDGMKGHVLMEAQIIGTYSR
jgi:Raf kinase inhibitor-like YbhB/YbcL family protein